MASRFRDFLVSITPGNDYAKAAQLRQSAEERQERNQEKQATAREADRKANARAHKARLARKGSGARLF
ncbi:hypothetical protein QEH48_gp096 [Streptomyces phage TurkishDelight]|uniref:Uncharacterized protein n=2 Tax=root TaxID=1 RepID=A0A7T0M198_9CAUD|nr:hypothetical protein QEH48_gp096 [Streptomyces phage TurkishDelight]QPL14125.1 hypothetical protein SEA_TURKISHDELIGHT_96 [Streptomyces phage TurkishDelight]